MINRIRGEHANHYTTDAGFFFYLLEIWKVHIILQEYTKKKVREMNYPETHATDGHWAQDIERRHRTKI